MAVETHPAELSAQSSALTPETFQALMDLLARFHAEVDALADLEQLKQDAVITSDLTALAQVSVEQEKQGGRLRDLEAERQMLVSQFRKDGQPEPTVRELAEQLPPPSGEALQQAATNLVITVQRMRQQAQANASLLLWAADLARNTAQWLLGQGQNASGYNRLGDRESKGQLSVRAWSA